MNDGYFFTLAERMRDDMKQQSDSNQKFANLDLLNMILVQAKESLV